jgi:hypothetical protein
MNPPSVPGSARVLAPGKAGVCALTLLLCLAGSFFLSAQEGKSETDGDYTIHGTVFNSVTHAAIGRALVYSTDNRYATLTDGEGHFELKISQPPREQGSGLHTTTRTIYRGGFAQIGQAGTSIFLMARKPGYFDNQGGPQAIDVGPATASEIRISLVPEARITGRVILPVNDGTEKIQVAICRRQVQEGRGKWIAMSNVTTRANGEFRFANLQEGEYKLLTQELLDRDPLTFDPRGTLFGYPPVYYPAAADFESAAVIQLKAGQTFSAMLTPAKREYYPVKLGVLNAAAGAGISISVEPQGHPGPGYSLGYNANESTIAGTLPNGNYSLEATQYSQNGSTGRLNFSVNGAPLQGPTVMLAPNNTIEVRADDERTKAQKGPGAELQNILRSMNLRLVPAGNSGSTNPGWLQPPKDPNDQSLFFVNVQPGTYRVRTGCSPGGYAASLNSGGIDLLRQPLVAGFGAAIAPIEITIRDDGAQVNGSIENWPVNGPNQPMRSFSGTPAVIVFLPLPDSSGQFCQTWVSPSGEFNLTQVPPGEYRVIAFDHQPQELEYENPEAIAKYEDMGQVLRLVPGQNEHLRLSLNRGGQ